MRMVLWFVVVSAPIAYVESAILRNSPVYFVDHQYEVIKENQFDN